MTKGVKYDLGKPRWSLFPRKTLASVLEVFEQGAQKYEPHGYAEIEDPKTRYYDALMRHIQAWHHGELLDVESKLPHLAHVAANALILLWVQLKQ